MIEVKRRVVRWLSLLAIFGVDIRKFYRSLKALPRYFRDLRALRSQLATTTHPFRISTYRPYLAERHAEGGSARGHYFWQDLLVAQRVFANRPTRHIDIGSRIDGFVAHVAAFREIEIFDIRPVTIDIPNIRFSYCDLMADLGGELIDSCDSLSCLHTIEHFGLGRYGDPIAADGYLRGLENLYRILQKGGKFYFSVPIGGQRIEFNGQRVFSLEYLLELMGKRYQVDAFSYVDDAGDLYQNVELTSQAIATNCGCNYGCGIFEMTKL